MGSSIHQRIEVNPSFLLSLHSHTYQLRLEVRAQILSDLGHWVYELLNCLCVFVLDSKSPGILVKDKSVSENGDALLPELLIVFHQIVDVLEPEA